MAGDVAILIVNGFDRFSRRGNFEAAHAERFPWIEICLRQVTRWSQGSRYRVLVWDNSQLESHRTIIRRHGADLYPDLLGRSIPPMLSIIDHPVALDQLVSVVGPEFEYLITLDTDAFPIKAGWIEELIGQLDQAAITGVWRDEMEEVLDPYIHPSCLCIRRDVLLSLSSSFVRNFSQDVGQNLTYELLGRGQRLAPLRRSNARNAHFIMAGIYGDLIYHHGAGSSAPRFRITEGVAHERQIHRALTDAAFDDLDGLIAVLRGQSDVDLGLTWNEDVVTACTSVARALEKPSRRAAPLPTGRDLMISYGGPPGVVRPPDLPAPPDSP